MEYYLININDFSVLEKSNEYNFIKELYPVISDEYYKLWFLQNLSEITAVNKDKSILEKDKKIERLLEICSLPEKILLTKAGNYYMEPLSKSLFIIKNKEVLEKTSERIANTYLLKNKKNNSFIEKIRDFKNITLVRNYISK